MQARIHKPVVAGLFYPSRVNELQHLLKDLLAVNTEELSKPKAIIVPHAGYIYSGPTAAAAYGPLAKYREQIKRVVLVGPAHRYPFFGIATSEVDFFATPLGNIPLDRAGIAMALTNAAVHFEERAFAQEHSLEVQLPFLQSVLTDFSLIPLLVGNVEPAILMQVLLSLWNEQTLFVISSDLSHYLPYDQAQAVDSETVKAILALNPAQVDYEQACGKIGINALLMLAKQRGLKPQLIDYHNSGDTAGDKEKVVGYGAFYFTE